MANMSHFIEYCGVAYVVGAVLLGAAFLLMRRPASN
jgi:heme oxygenase